MPFFDVTAAAAFDPADVAPAILEAVGDALLAGGGVIYFPPGRFPVGQTIHVADARCLRFVGEGDASILERAQEELPGLDAAGIFAFERCTAVTIERLSLDARGFQPPIGSVQRALVQFDGLAAGVTIQDVRVLDSDTRHDDPDDLETITHRYDTAHHVAFGFRAADDATAQDVSVRRCKLQYLGIAIHGGRRVRIADNDIVAPIGHGIAVGAGQDRERVNEDVWITGNRIREAARFAIVAADIPPTPEPGFEPEPLAPTRARRIRIAGNSIRKERARWARGIVVGVLDNRPTDASFTGLFEDVLVSDNEIDLRPDGPRPAPLGDGSTPPEERARVAGIWLQTQPAGAERPANAFSHARVRDNVIVVGGDGPDGLGPGIVAWNLTESEVAGNGLSGVGDGLVLMGDLHQSHVHDNRAFGATDAPYRYGSSLGGNWFSSNATVDASGAATRATWLWSRTDSSDQFQGGDEFAGGQGLIGHP